MHILGCTSNDPFNQSVRDILKVDFIEREIYKFADKEIFVEIKDNVRGKNVFVIQSLATPVNDNLMELLITIDALRRASAEKITAVIPYFAYARQDRKTAARTPISAKLIANLLCTNHLTRVLTLDLHAEQIQGFFDIPVDNLYAATVFIEDIVKKYTNIDDIVIVSPDVGGLKRARSIAKKIGADLAIVDKRREKAGQSEVMNIIGNIKNKECIIIDDIIDSGGTLCNAAQSMIDLGAHSVAAYITHGVLSGEAINRINNSSLSELIITDSIDNSEKIMKSSKIRLLSVSQLISNAITIIADGGSISSLFT